MDNQNYQPWTPQGQGGGNAGFGSGAAPGLSANGQPITPQNTGMAPQPLAGMGPMPTSQLPATAKQQKSQKNIWMIVGIAGIGFSLLFFILFVVMFANWNNVKTDVDGQISVAVATARI